jgi:5'-3' exonuclease
MTVSWDDLSDVVQAKEEAATANNLLLLDGVNIAFRYLQRHNYANYTDDYIRTVTSLGKSYQAKRIICCFDSGASVYRKGIFPEYKDNRKIERSEEDQERFEKFFACLSDTIEQLPFEYYKFRGIEADDLIAYFTKNLSQKYTHTWVVSSDRDLFQLLKQNVSIFNLYSRKEITVDTLLNDTGLTPKQYAFSRIIEGDKGDNIRGIEGIGPKRSADLVSQYGTLDNLLSALPIPGKAKYIKNLNEGANTLVLNEKLINLLDYNMSAINAVEKSDSIIETLQKAVQ